jgi:hypothetical protein
MTKRGSRLATARGAPRRRTRRTARTGAPRFAGRTSTSTRSPPRGADAPGTRAAVVCAARTTRSKCKTPSFENKRATPPRGGRARAPERAAETRPKNWRERIGAEAAAELAALGDVFAERRRETTGVARGSSSSSSSHGLEGNDGRRARHRCVRERTGREERRIGRVVFLLASPTRASRSAARPNARATRETADDPIRPDSVPTGEPSFPVSCRPAEGARLCRLCASPRL